MQSTKQYIAEATADVVAPTVPLLMPAPPHISSRLPMPSEIMAKVARVALALICCLLMMYLFLFICLCVLLARANVPEVRSACAGFWDFMLATIFIPMAIPLLYCMIACCFWVSWQAFYGACSLVLAIACLHMSLTAGENPACVDALRRTSEPLPWLLYAGYIKGALFATGTLSSILARSGGS